MSPKVGQRHWRQAAEYAGDGQHPYVRIRLGQAQHLCPDVSGAARPFPREMGRRNKEDYSRCIGVY